MGILSRLNIFAAKKQTETDIVPAIGKGRTTNYGLEEAKQNPVVRSCVELISSSIGAMGIHLYERQDNGRVRRTDHPIYKLIHSQPNPYNSPFVFKRQILIDCLTSGNFFGWIQFNRSTPVGIYRIDPDKVTVGFDVEGYYYTVKTADGDKVLYQDEILHIQGFSFNNPFSGDSAVKAVKNSASLSKSASELAESYFGQGILGGTILKHPNKLNKVQRETLRKDIDSASGLSNAFSFLLLEDGMSLDKLEIDLDKLQLTGLMQFSTKEICRVFQVPGILIGETEGTSQYGVGETLYSIFWKDCLRKWAILIEEEFSRKLLREDEKDYLYIEVDNNSLLRGDPAYEQDILINYVNSKIFTVDEARAKLNLPPLPAVEQVQTNSFSLAKKKILEDISARVKTKEELAMKKASKRSKEDFENWVEDFYQQQLDTIDKYSESFTEVLELEDINELKKTLVFDRVEALDKQNSLEVKQ